MELPESVVNGRFNVTERPTVFPGKCAVCGTVERPVVDFGMTLDYYGAVLLCVECVTSAYNTVQLVMGDESAPAPAVPHFLDGVAINEYVRFASDSINRLSILLDLNGVPASKGNEEVFSEPELPIESIESTIDESDGVSEESESLVEQEPLFVIDKGSISVSTSSSDGDLSDFGL